MPDYSDYLFDTYSDILLYIEGMCDSQKNNVGMQQILDLLNNATIKERDNEETVSPILTPDIGNINWEKYKEPNGSFDLVSIFYDIMDAPYRVENHMPSIRYLSRVTAIRPVTSRQIAALALAHAFSLIQ